MRLKSVHIKEFRSIWDSNSFDTGRVTCLVGKNEAGKTALLQALYRLNPIVESDRDFDVTDDYPRSHVEDYQQDIEAKRRNPADVVEATFALDDPELKSIQEHFGKRALEKPEIVLSRGYTQDKEGDCILYVRVPVVESAVVKHLVDTHDLPGPVGAGAKKTGTIAELAVHLADIAKQQEAAVASGEAKAKEIEDEKKQAAALKAAKRHAESEQSKQLRAKLAELQNTPDLGMHIWTTLLRSHFPKFLYFDEYYQMRGHDNVEALKERKASGELEPPDYPLLGLIDLARLDLDKLLDAKRTQELKNKLQGASNHLSNQVLDYWSQNKHLRMNFDVRGALAEDPEGMQEGTNIWGEVQDTIHLVNTGLGTRSRGFVWFFSFLAWYSAIKKQDQPLVLLLDEPGLSLHGKAQQDLLRYFEKQIVTNPKHQLIYSTHSPFMVDPTKFDRVRIVQDNSIDQNKKLPREKDGTKVFTDVLEAGPDSLFPLQGALGYEMSQTLFIGPNSLVVEGVSDLLYIQTISSVLDGAGRQGLDGRWTITPVGGSDKVPTFVALIGAQTDLNVATLIDYQKKDQQVIENLYKRKLLKKSNVMTFADFTGKAESDIEDMFDEEFYLELVNKEFATSLTAELKPKDIAGPIPRVLVRLENFLSKNPLKAGVNFNHYRPSRYFAEKIATLKVPDDTLDKFEEAFKAVNALLG